MHLGPPVRALRRALIRVDGPAAAPGPRSAAQLRDAYTAGLRRAVATAVLAWYPCTLPVLFVLPAGRYPRPAVLGLWCALGVCVLVVTRRVRRRPATRLDALGLVAVALVVTVATAALVGVSRPDGSRLAIWPVLILPLLLMQVTVARPRRERIIALVATTGTLTAIACADGVPGPLPATQLVAVLNALASLQIVAAMGGPVLLRSADAAARAIDSEARLAARQEAELRIRMDRARALGMIRREVLPLLTALRDGLVDPRDPAVRARCRRDAGTIRRTLVTSQTATLGELAPALFEAETRDLRVDVQVSGDLRAVPDEVRAELAWLLPRALRSLSDGRALLTLICTPAAGSLTLTVPGTSLPPDWTGMTTAGGGEARPDRARLAAVAVRADADDGQLCLDLHWPAGGGLLGRASAGHTRSRPA
ncbi:Histidine kinase (fragment) [Frankia canadensis]|uniref:Histidine kinase n=1 Tax=Frankia canadensis TaxID=1836972 RepID=A0A2I2L0S0_9ACTN